MKGEKEHVGRGGDVILCTAMAREGGQCSSPNTDTAQIHGGIRLKVGRERGQAVLEAQGRSPHDLYSMPSCSDSLLRTVKSH